MKRNLQLLLILLMTTFITQAQIVITEIMYNPPEDGQDSLEYIELYNNSGADIDLAGYQFTDGVDHTFDAFNFVASSYLVVAKNDTAFNSTFGFMPIQWTNGSLKNGGEKIELTDADGNVVSFVDFDDNDPWPTQEDGTDGYGASIELCDITSDMNDAANWSVSQSGTGIVIAANNGDFEILGSPGLENTADCNSLPTGDYTVIANGLSFTPKDITIMIGESVLWDNQSGSHNVNGSLATFPDNPEGFSSGAVEVAPWLFSHTFTIAGVYNYQCDPHAGAGMTGTVTVLAEPLPVYPIRDIITVSQEGDDGVCTFTDSLATLEGVVYGTNLRPSGLQFTIMDDGGNGIGVFSANHNYDYVVAEGDKISIQGKIGQYNGLTQIYADTVLMISSGNSLLDAVIVTELNESTESILVKLEGLRVISDWGNAGSGFNVDVTNGTDTFTMRIDNDVTIEDPTTVPSSTFDLTGLGGQYDNSSPFNSGYQIFPRYASDILIIAGTEILDGSGRFELSPNPVKDRMSIRTDLTIESYEVFNIMGKKVMGGIFNNNLMVSELKDGLYIVKLNTKQAAYTMKFIKQ